MADIGDFRYKIDIKSRDINPINSTVQRVDTFTDVYSNIWADIDQTGDLTEVDHKDVGNTAIFDITIRYRTGINAEMWVFWNGSRLMIRGIQPDRKKIYMTLTCEWDDDDYS